MSVYEKGSDIWLRSRTNAMAQHLAGGAARRKALVLGSAEAIFLVIPVILIGVAYTLSSAENGPTHRTSVLVLTVLAMVSSGLALLINMLIYRLKYDYQAEYNERLSQGYAMVAQKARRLEDAAMPEEEGKLLCNTLEETFEMYKAMGTDPSPEIFEQAKRAMMNLNVYPFGLSAEQAGGAKNA